MLICASMNITKLPVKLICAVLVYAVQLLGDDLNGTLQKTNIFFNFHISTSVHITSWFFSIKHNHNHGHAIFAPQKRTY